MGRSLKVETSTPHDFIPHPRGMAENSPAFQRRDAFERALSPEGTAELDWPQPSLRDSFLLSFKPGVETPGYCHLSLRDTKISLAQILWAPITQAASASVSRKPCRW